MKNVVKLAAWCCLVLFTATQLTFGVVPPACAPVPSNAVAWWPGEGNGSDIINGNTAILDSGVAFAPGQVGQAFQLENPTNGFMHAPASASLNVGAGSGMTMEGWINVASVDGLHPIAEWYGTNRGVIGVQLWLNPSSSGSGSLFGALVDTNGNLYTLLSPSGTLAANVFQHVAMTYDRASGEGALYVNGTVVAQDSFGSFTPQTSYDLWIGHRPFDVEGDSTFGAALGGLLDEFTLYNRALASNEIAAIYNAGVAGKCPAVVGTPPSILTQPTNRTVSVGGNASFSVTVSGPPPLFYQWYKGGAFIPGANTSMLTLTNVQNTNAGTYFVFVTNAFGFAMSSNAVLTVTGNTNTGAAPAITHQPTNQTVAAGSSASFSVTATGSPTLHYQWYGPTNNVIPGANNSTLTLSNVQPANAGTYLVIVTNLFGSATSSNAVLTVTGGGGTNGSCTPPPSGIVGWWPGEGNGSDIIGGNTAVLGTGVTYGPGKVGQAFRFSGTNGFISVNTSSNLDIGKGNGLTIEAWIKPDHELDGTGLPLIEWGTSDSVGMHLWVEEGLRLYANIRDITGTDHQIETGFGTITTSNLQHVALTYNKTNGTAVLYINGLAVTNANFGNITPQTSYPLYFGKRPLSGWDQLYNGLLDEVSLYSRALSGSEIAAIYNAGSAGKCNSNTVNVGPTITHQPTNQTVVAGSSASFTVTATGSPTLHYQWYKSGNIVLGAINPTLTFSNAQPANAGTYHVIVTNLFGSVTSSNAVLTVNGGGDGGGTNACLPPPSGLVGLWKAEGNALNSIGGNNGTLLGGLGFINGEVDQAFNFVNNTQGVQVNASPSLAVHNITIEAWINPTDVSDFHPIVEYGADTGPAPVEFLYGWNDPGGTTPGALFGIIRGTNDTWLKINSPAGILPTGKWSHVAMTFDFASQTGRLYLNGTNVALNVYTNGFLTLQTSLPVHIGYRPDTSGEGRAGSRHSGGLDEVSIYNRALNESEIAAIYNAGAAGKCSPTNFHAFPTITHQPTNQTVAVGNSASFTVTATGYLTLHYQWYGPTNNVIPGANNSILTLSNVQPANAGTYYVIVANLFGSATSSNALLTVNGGGGNTNGSCTPPASGIAAWWPGEGNGNDIVNGNTAILESGVSFAPGKVGQAFLLQNPTNGFAHVPASASLNIGAGSGLTMEGWINVASVDGFHPIAEWYGPMRNAVGVQLWLNSSPNQSGALFGALVETNGNQHTLVSPSSTLAANVFQHVAMTYDRASGQGTLYVNGTVAAQGNFGSFTPQTSYNLWIGHRPFDVEGDWTFGTTLGGLLDELTLYSRALSSNEIAAIYNAGSAGKCHSNTVNMGPTVTHQPTNQTVAVGNSASFTVTATGSPTLHYQWYGPTNNVIPGANNFTLTLSNVQPANAGTYYVIATNLFGSATSSNAVLTVTGGSGTNGFCTPPASGIAAWWRAENNVNDSVNGNNGTIIGGVGYAAGEVGQAFRFSGTNGYISVPASSNLNIGAGSGITIECWIKPDHLGPVGADGRPIVEFDTPNAIGVHLFFEHNSTLYANIVDTSNVTHSIQTAPGTIVTNALQHVAVTYDKSSGNCFLYINGVPAASANFGNITPQTSYPLSIGLRAANGFPGSGSLYNGLLDELSLYSRALSGSEIAAIYNAGSAGKCSSNTVNVGPAITHQPTNQTVVAGSSASFTVTATGSPTLHYQWYKSGNIVLGAINPTLTFSNAQPANAGTYHVIVTNLFGSVTSSNAVLTVNGGGDGGGTNGSCTPPASGIAAWWPGEGNGNDIIGGNTAILESGVTFAAGKAGQAFQLQNYTNGFGHAPASSSLNIGAGSGLTIEGWIKVSSVDGLHPIVEWYGDERGKSGVQLWLNSSPFQSGALSGALPDTNSVQHTLVSSAGVLTANVFQHVAMTYDRTSGIETLYANGVAVAQGNMGSFVPQTTYNLWFGHRPFDVDGDWTFGATLGGLLDELTLYSRALSSNEIAAIYNAGAAGKCTSGTTTNSSPMITKQPANQTVSIGGNVSFSVTATGSPTLHYQWYGPGAVVIPGATSSTLTLTNVQPKNSGAYSVLVTNLLGSVMSSNAALTIFVPATSVIAGNVAAPSGSTFDLPVNIVANGKENALSFSLNFDPTRLTYSSISLGLGAGDAMLLPNVSQAASGKIGIQLALPSGETFPTGTHQLIRVTFSSSTLLSTQLVTVVSFSDQPIAKLVADALGHTLNANFVNGTVALTLSAFEGDVSPRPLGDRKLDLFDWVQVGRFVAGLDVITNGSEYQKADCAPRDTLGDGQLKVTDWVQAGRYAAGLDPLTPVGGPTGPVIPAHSSALFDELTTREITVNSGSTVKGLMVTLPITLEAQGDESALAFTLNFDPAALRYVSTEKGSAVSTANLVVNSNQAASGRLPIVLCLANPGSHLPAGTLEIAKVTFVAIATTTNNTVSFTDAPMARSISDVNAAELPANYVGNSVIVNPQPTVNLASGASTAKKLSWPIWAGDFTLQAAGSLTPPINWTNVPVSLHTNGDNIEVTLPVPDNQTFFRLYHP